MLFLTKLFFERISKELGTFAKSSQVFGNTNLVFSILEFAYDVSLQNVTPINIITASTNSKTDEERTIQEVKFDYCLLMLQTFRWFYNQVYHCEDINTKIISSLSPYCLGVNLFHWAMANGCKYSPRIIDYAILNTSKEMLTFALSIELKLDSYVGMKVCAKVLSNMRNVLTFMFEEKLPVGVTVRNLTVSAIKNGNIEDVKFLLNDQNCVNDPYWNAWAFCTALHNGSEVIFQLVKSLVKLPENFKLDDYRWNQLVSAERFSMLDYLLETCPTYVSLSEILRS